tara:strand:+ start:351 stop:509 length:159 start_codon:yes stop_codon:yes gene_type:complete
MYQLPENATLVERMQYYVNYEQADKARALATVADFLEDCYSWDVDFNKNVFN